MTPFIGFHVLLAFAVAWALRGNMIAAAVGTMLGNPLTFPFIWAGTFQIGELLLPGYDHDVPVTLADEAAQEDLGQILPYFTPMLVGSLPMGLAVGCITYFVVYRMVTTYQSARQSRLAEVRRDRGE